MKTMKGFFIFATIALLASCQKEASQMSSTQAPLQMTEINPAKIFIPGGAVSSGKFKLTFAQLSSVIPIGSAEFQFTVGRFTYKFNDSISAIESVQYGVDQIEIQIDCQKDPYYSVRSRYQLLIKTNGQVSPGTYTFQGTNSAWFSQFIDDVVDVPQDFSLQVLSYKNGYLDAIFNSSGFSNGIINHLKITKQ
jgi:hypothetical protein